MLRSWWRSLTRRSPAVRNVARTPKALALERLETREVPATNVSIIAGASGTGDQDAVFLANSGSLGFTAADTAKNTLSAGAIASITGAVQVQSLGTLTFGDLGGSLALTTATAATFSTNAIGGANIVFTNTTDSLSLSSGNLTFDAAGTLSAGFLTATTGNITLRTGANFTFNSTAVALGTVRLTTTGTVGQAAGAIISAVALGVRAGGNVTLGEANSLATVAAKSTGRFELNATGSLSTGSVTADGTLFTATSGIDATVAVLKSGGSITLGATHATTGDTLLIATGSVSATASTLKAAGLSVQASQYAITQATINTFAAKTTGTASNTLTNSQSFVIAGITQTAFATPVTVTGVSGSGSTTFTAAAAAATITTQAVVSQSGGVQFIADDAAIGASVSGTIVGFGPFTANTNVFVGGTGTGLSISQTELALITSPTVAIGTTSANDLTVNAAASVGTSALQLTAAGAISQTGIITAGSVTASGKSVALGLSNVVPTVSLTATNGAASFKGSAGVQINGAGATDSVAVTATGALIVAGAVTAGTSVTLTGTTTISQTAGGITAVGLVANAGTSVALNSATNDVDTFTALGGAAVQFTDADDLTLTGFATGVSAATIAIAGALTVQGPAAANAIAFGRNATTTTFQYAGGPVVQYGGATSLTYAGGTANDSVTVRFSALGAVLPGNLLTVTGGGGTTNGVAVIGTGSETTNYAPSGTTPGTGTISVGSASVVFSGLTPVDISNMGSARLLLPGADDAVTIAAGSDFVSGGTNAALQITGTSGGVAFEKAAFFNNLVLSIDTDGVSAGTADTITVTGAANNHGNASVFLSTGAGVSDSIAVTGAVSVTAGLRLRSNAVSQTGTLTAGTFIDISSDNGLNSKAAVVAPSLRLSGAGAFSLTTTTNAITTLAADGLTSLAYVDTDGFTVGTVSTAFGSTTGVSATGSIGLTAGGANTLTLAADLTTSTVTSNTSIALQAGASTITTGSAILQTGGKITAVSLSAIADTITLTQPGNDVDNFSAKGNAVSFTDADGVNDTGITGGSGALIINGVLTVTGSAGNNSVTFGRSTGGSLFYQFTGGPQVTYSGATSVSYVGGAANDIVTVQFSAAGAALPSGGLSVQGNGGTTNGVRAIGTGSETTVYSPDAATFGNGTIAVNGTSITFTGLTPVDIATMNDVTLDLPGANDVVNVTAGTDFLGGGANQALRVTGTSDGVAFEKAAFFNNKSLTINTDANKAGADTITVTSANNAHGNASVFLRTDKGVPDPADSIAINGAVSVTAAFQAQSQRLSQAAQITAGTFVELSSRTGLTTTSAIVAPNLLLLGSGTFNLTAGTNAVTNLAANVTGPLTYSTSSSVTINTVAGVGGSTTGVTATGSVTLNVNALDIAQKLDVGTGVATIQPFTAGNGVTLGNGGAGLTLGDAEFDKITANTIQINTAAAGNITFTASITVAGATTVGLTAGGEITQLNGDPFDLLAQSLVAQANTGIGNNQLVVEVSTLSAVNSTSGVVEIVNRGDATVGALSNNTGNAAGSITLFGVATPGETGSLSLTLGASAGGAVSIDAAGSLQLAAGQLVRSFNMSATLTAGGPVTLETGSKLQATAAGQTAEVSSDSSITLTAATVTADGAVNVDADGTLTSTGATLVQSVAGSVTASGDGGVTLGAGASILATAAAQTVLVQSSAGSVSLTTTTVTAGGNVSVLGTGTVTTAGVTAIQSTGGSVTAAGVGGVSLGTGGSVTAAGTALVQATAGNVTIAASTVTATGNVTVSASGTLTTTGATLVQSTANNVTVTAGGDVSLGGGASVLATAATKTAIVQSTGGSVSLAASTVTAGGNVTVAAAGTVTTAGATAVQSTGGSVTAAGVGGVSLGTGGSVTAAGTALVQATAGNVTIAASTVTATGNVTVSASGTLTTSGATVVQSTAGSVTVTAGGDVSLGGGASVLATTAAKTALVQSTGGSVLFGNSSVTAGGNASILANGSIGLGSVSSGATATLTATTGNITVAGGSPSVTAPALAATAATGIGSAATPVTISVNNLEAATTSGGIFFANNKALAVGGVTGTLTGVDAIAGDVSVSAAGGITIILAGENVTAGAGSVTVAANGAASDLTTAGNQAFNVQPAVAASGTTTLTAGRDVLLGTSANGFGDVTGGTVSVTAVRDFVAAFNLDVVATGLATITAGRDILLGEAGGSDGDVTAATIALNATRDVTLTAESVLTATSSSVTVDAGQNITLQGVAASLPAIVSPLTTGVGVRLTAGQNVTVAAGGVTDKAVSTAGSHVVVRATAGAIALNGGSVSTGTTGSVCLIAATGIAENASGAVNTAGLLASITVGGNIILGNPANSFSTVAASTPNGTIKLASSTPYSVGTVTCGTITLTGLTGNGLICLESVGGFTQAANAPIIGNQLGIRNTGSGDVILAADKNDVNQLGVDNKVGRVTFRDVDDLTIDTIPCPVPVVGIQTKGGGTGGDVLIDAGGPLTLNQVVTAAGSTVRLSAVGGVTQAAAGVVTAAVLGVRNATSGAIALGQNNAVGTFAATNGATGQPVVLFSNVATTVGTVDVPAANDGIAFAKVSGVTTAGNGDVLLSANGGLTLTQAVSAGAGVVRLVATGGNITQTATGLITAGAVGARATAGFVALGQKNSASVFAVSTNGGRVTFGNSKSLNVGGVGGVTSGLAAFAATNGIATAGGDVLLDVTGGLTLSQAVTAGTGTVRLHLNTGDLAQAAAGTITASALGIRVDGNGAVALGGANGVDTVAANLAGQSGAFTFTSTKALTVGTVAAPAVGDAPSTFAATSGITTQRGTVSITTTSNGGIALAQSINTQLNGAALTLVATGGGVTEAATAAVVGTKLTLAGTNAGSFTLNSAGNRVPVITAAINGNLIFRTGTDLTIDSAGVATKGGSVTLTATGNFTAVQPPPGAPLFALGVGSLQVNAGAGSAKGGPGAVVTFNTEVNASSVTFGVPLAAADQTDASQGNDSFNIRPSATTPIRVNGNRVDRDFPADAPTIPPNGDSLTLILTGFGGAVGIAFAPGKTDDGTITFGGVRQPLTFESIESLQGRQFEAFAYQTGPNRNDFAIRVTGTISGAPLNFNVALPVSVDNPFVVTPSIIDPTGPFNAPQLVFGKLNNQLGTDLVIAAGPGSGPLVTVVDLDRLSSSVDANGNLIAGTNVVNFFSAQFYAYAPNFAGGVNIAVGDIDNAGAPGAKRDEIITGAGAGGGPHVRVFRYDPIPLDPADTFNANRFKTVTPYAGGSFDFFAYDAGFRGGVRVAAGDVDGDGRADIVTAAGAGGGPHVKVFRSTDGATVRSFFAYAPNFTGGVRVAAGDYNRDGFADILTGPGVGGGPHIKVFSGLYDTPVFPEVDIAALDANPSDANLKSAGLLANFLAFTGPSAVVVDLADQPGANKSQAVAFSGANGDGTLQQYQFAAANPSSLFPTDPPTPNGITSLAFVNFNNDTVPDIAVSAGFRQQDLVQVYAGAQSVNAGKKLGQDVYLPISLTPAPAAIRLSPTGNTVGGGVRFYKPIFNFGVNIAGVTFDNGNPIIGPVDNPVVGPVDPGDGDGGGPGNGPA